jgi:putative sterol carrier protein
MIMTHLNQALHNFVAIYHATEKLVAEQADWQCAIQLLATDTQEMLTLRLVNGRVVEIGHDLAQADLLVKAEMTTLLDILEFRRDPNEPYLFGELTIQGAEAHFLRLDYVVTQLCQ